MIRLAGRRTRVARSRASGKAQSFAVRGMVRLATILVRVVSLACAHNDESNRIISSQRALPQDYRTVPYRTVRSLPIRIIPYSSTPYHSILQTQRHNDTTTRSKTCVRAAGPTTVDQTATSYDHQSPTATETFTPVAYSSTSYYYSYYYYYYYYYYSYYSYATLGRRRQQLG